jgi:hypothetical protein
MDGSSERLIMQPDDHARGTPTSSSCSPSFWVEVIYQLSATDGFNAEKKNILLAGCWYVFHLRNL